MCGELTTIDITRNLPVKAFGKFIPGRPLALRGFEKFFGIRAREGFEAWTSTCTSVQNLLDHLGRFTKSLSSREKYLQVLCRFCLWKGSRPDDLVSLPKTKVEGLIQSFVDELAVRGGSRSYLNSLIKRLKCFFRANGYEALKVDTYFIPSRYRKRPEYIPTKSEVYAMAEAAGSLRNRALILVLWSSGLRVSTLSALNFGDVAEDLEKKEPYILISVYPEMKERVPDACKGRIPYYTFISLEASEALRTYLRDREVKYGSISLDDPLFFSDWTLWSRDERSGCRLGRRGVGLVVKRGARLAGVQEWRYVTSHCLRKAFESVLRSSTIDGGRMDKGTQEFFIGHILPGSQDPYYDRTKVSFHREEYAKLDFSRSEISKRKMKDKLIDIAELEAYFNIGWIYVSKISNNKAIVRRMA